MNSASSLPKYVHAFATSFGVELRPSGIVAMNGFSFSFFPRKRSVLSNVSMQTQQKPAHSQASAQSNDWADRTEADLVWSELDSHGLCRIDHSCFGSIIPSQPWPWANASGGSN